MTTTMTESICVIKMEGGVEVEYEEEWELEFDVTPGEEPVYYDSNMTGHPGCPPEAELLMAILQTRTKESVKVEVCDETMDGADWLEYSGEDERELEQKVFEHLGDQEQAAYEDACETECDTAREEGRRPRRIRGKY